MQAQFDWAFEVTYDLSTETREATIHVLKSLSATVYTSKQPKEQRLVKSLRRDDEARFEQVIALAAELKEQSLEVTHIDFDLVVTTAEQSRQPQSTQRPQPIRQTATSRQLDELPRRLEAAQAATGHAMAIRDH